MIATETAIETVKFYVNGKWEVPAGHELHPITNPATGRVIARTAYANSADIDRVARAAHEAFLKWREVPVVDRVQILYRYKDLLEKHADELAHTLTSENGKTLEDARGEIRRAIQMVEVSCGMPSLMMGQSLENVARGIDCHTIRQPLGVCAGITPFNFPGMVPAWMYPFAIACGNSFILKPSEKVPLTPTRSAELLEQAGCPPVFSTWCTEIRRRLTRCFAIRWCAESLSSAQPPSLSTFMRTPPKTASACKRWAARKTISSSCPMPTSTKPPRPSSAPLSALPASDVLRGASW